MKSNRYRISKIQLLKLRLKLRLELVYLRLKRLKSQRK